jgi:macrophage erythroblast attacher
MDHVQELETFTSTDSPEYLQWTDKRLDRWLVDWALRSGKPKTAKKLAEAKDIEVSL